ncbi:phosphatidate cytidylyltransferase [Actinomyces provencensis]|uniref:phosphatidate cytidylyltransferase n=1 Tax=Actinomyces provencensis TaxID=1720198 RepID=UPI00096A785D|nr:phosphatidate cytidylyltransferase [Actinomyces provencensis]
MATEPTRSRLDRILRPGPTQDHAPLPASGRAGRNLPAAVTTAVVLLGALAGGLVYWTPGFVALVVILCLMATWELGGAFARTGTSVTMPPLYVGTVGILVSAWTMGPEAMLVALFLTVFVIIAWRLMEGRGASTITDVITSVFCAVYVPFLAAFVLLMRSESGSAAVVGVYVAVTVSNDIGGWAAGVLFGKHPMSPRISPHKSWEGFAGSVLMCCAVGVAGVLLLGGQWWWGLVAGVAASVVGTVGDLTESAIKRETGLKDMSNLLPGHGGVLDRMDSLLMTAPVLYLVLRAALGW